MLTTTFATVTSYADREGNNDMWSVNITDAEGNQMRLRFESEQLARLAADAINTATNIAGDETQVYFADWATAETC